MLFYLAEKSVEAGKKTGVFTTVKMLIPQNDRKKEFFVPPEFPESFEKIAVFGVPGKEGKFGIPENYGEILNRFDAIFVEADGSKRLPLKFHATHEPQIIPENQFTIFVAGLSALDREFSQGVFRWENSPIAHTGKVDEGIFAYVVLSDLWELEKRNIGVDMIFLNQGDDEATLQRGRKIAEEVGKKFSGKIILGSVKNSYFEECT